MATLLFVNVVIFEYLVIFFDWGAVEVGVYAVPCKSGRVFWFSVYHFGL